MSGRAHTRPGDFMSLLDEQPSTVDRSVIRILPEFNPRFPLPGEDDPFSEQALADLTHSIREQGLLQPLLLRPASGGTYELIAGERRFHAAGYAGLREVPVYIRELNDEQARRAVLTENGQREAVPYAQEALNGLRDIARMSGLPLTEVPTLLNRLKNGVEDEFGVTPYLQNVFGETVSTWAQRRALVLKLLPEEFSALNERRATLTALQQLTRLGDRPERAALLSRLLAEELTADQLTQEVTALLKPAAALPRAQQLRKLRQALSHLEKLEGPDAERADQLIESLLQLVRR